LGEIRLGEMGLGAMGLGEMGQNHIGTTSQQNVTSSGPDIDNTISGRESNTQNSNT